MPSRVKASLVPIRCGLFIDMSCAEFEKLTAELHWRNFAVGFQTPPDRRGRAMVTVRTDGYETTQGHPSLGS